MNRFVTVAVMITTALVGSVAGKSDCQCSNGFDPDLDVPMLNITDFHAGAYDNGTTM
jgi:hypothetical protein